MLVWSRYLVSDMIGMRYPSLGDWRSFASPVAAWLPLSPGAAGQEVSSCVVLVKLKTLSYEINLRDLFPFSVSVP